MGNIYLKRIAEGIRSFGSAGRVAARLGGDEFLLLLYGYPDEEAVYAQLDGIRTIQRHTTFQLDSGKEVQVHFSFGYVMTYGREDYESMIAEADKNMYHLKRERKNTVLNTNHAAK